MKFSQSRLLVRCVMGFIACRRHRNRPRASINAMWNDIWGQGLLQDFNEMHSLHKDDERRLYSPVEALVCWPFPYVQCCRCDVTRKHVSNAFTRNIVTFCFRKTSDNHTALYVQRTDHTVHHFEPQFVTSTSCTSRQVCRHRDPRIRPEISLTVLYVGA